jgi:hypothetical protein
MARRADSATRRWARILMLPSRSFLAGAKILARVLTVRCTRQRGLLGQSATVPAHPKQIALQ